MALATQYAFPHEDNQYEGAVDCGGHGLTKLEYFAGLAMQGQLGAPTLADNTKSGIAKHSVDYARALIAELEKQS